MSTRVPQSLRRGAARRGRMLTGLGRWVVRHPGWVLCVAAAVTAASVIYAAGALELKTERVDLLSPRLPFNRRFLD